jgi:hypothetical protein
VIRHDVLLVELAARIGGLEKTSQQPPRFGQAWEIRLQERAQAPLELRALERRLRALR